MKNPARSTAFGKLLDAVHGFSARKYGRGTKAAHSTSIIFCYACVSVFLVQLSPDTITQGIILLVVVVTSRPIALIVASLWMRITRPPLASR